MSTTQEHVDFVHNAIRALRTEGRKGIHTVFSGFNEAFRLQFPDRDPVKTTIELANAGHITSHPAKRGAMIYLPGDGPQNTKGEDALAKIQAASAPQPKLVKSA